MPTKKFMWVLLSAFIAIWVLGFISQTMAETRKGKTFHYTAKVEMVPIPNTEGHVAGMIVREGVNTYEDGEQGWNKTVIVWDGVKDVGTFAGARPLHAASDSPLSGWHAQGRGEVIVIDL